MRLSATINKEGAFEFEASKVGKDTVLAQAAQAKKLRPQRRQFSVLPTGFPVFLFLLWQDLPCAYLLVLHLIDRQHFQGSA